MANNTRNEQSGWTAIDVDNFRRFKSTGVLRYAPVTLLFGRNSSGKTSILRAPLLLRQMIVSPGISEVAFSGAGFDFGSFAELTYGGDVKNDIVIRAEIRNEDRDIARNSRYVRELGQEYVDLMSRMVVEVSLHWNITRARTVFNHIYFSEDFGSEPLVEFVRTGLGKFTMKVRGEKPLRVNEELNMQSVRIQSLVSARSDGPGRFDILLFVLANSLQLAAEKLIHIRPLRDEPDRAYRLDQIGINSPGMAVDVLRSSGVAVNRLVSNALKQLGMASGIKLEKLAPGYVAIALTDPDTGRRDNIADVGFGVSQVLPIITTLATAPRGSTVLIEQPELHLHPAAQGNLADVMYEMALSRGLNLVIESHSEHLLLRLQRRIAEEKLGKDDVATYFIDKGEVRLAEIDEFGQIDMGAMPEGFFEDDWIDLMHTTQAAAKRQKAKG
jgi:predicted ATPase